MTPKEKAEELIEKFEDEIGCSDFHIPEFISGVPCADGNSEYGKILDDATKELATRCALICVEEILNLRLIGVMGRGNGIEEKDFWKQVSAELSKQ